MKSNKSTCYLLLKKKRKKYGVYNLALFGNMYFLVSISMGNANISDRFGKLLSVQVVQKNDSSRKIRDRDPNFFLLGLIRGEFHDKLITKFGVENNTRNEVLLP